MVAAASVVPVRMGLRAMAVVSVRLHPRGVVT